MTREEELKLQAEWLSKNQVTASIGREYFKIAAEELRPEYCKKCPWWESESTTAKRNKCRLCQ